MAKSTAMIKSEDWEWSEERERAYQMKLRGFPNTQIAAELDVHRNTIMAWCKHPVFAKRLEEELLEFARDSRLRRVRATTVFTDRISNLATRSLKTLEKNPKSMQAISRVKALLGEFRAMRNEERLNYGEATENHSVIGSITHNGRVTTMSSVSFKEFLKDGIQNGVINAKLVSEAAGKDGNKKAALVEAVQQALVDGELIRQLDREAGIQDPTQAAIDAEYSAVDDVADESEQGQQGPEVSESE
jgi:hypothetical protein